MTTQTQLAGTRSPEEIDPDLAQVIYVDRRHELTSFFFRRTQNAELTAALVAQTFATAALIRMKRPEKSEHDYEWLTSIGALELSCYFRYGAVAGKAINTVDLEIPQLSEAEVDRLTEEVQLQASHRQQRMPTNELIAS